MSIHPASSPPAPERRRWLVLVGVGLLLLAPLVPTGWDVLTERHLGLREEVARRFLRAYLASDARELAGLLTRGAGRFAGGLGAASEHEGNLTFEVGKPEGKDLNVAVPFTLQGKPGLLQMTWEGTGWRVRSMTHPCNESGEGPLLDYAELARRRPNGADVKVHRALAPLDARALQRSCRASLNVRGELAGRLLRGRLSNVRLSLTLRSTRVRSRLPSPAPSQPAENWETTPITLSLRQRTLLEIIEAVARQAGIGLRQSERAMAVSPPQEHPVTGFAGPFRLEVKGLAEDPHHATGSLSLDALAVRLPASLLATLRGFRPVLPDPEVRGAGERDLFHADRRERVPLPEVAVNQDQRTCYLRWQVPLRNLTADVERIRLVRGGLMVPLPVRLDTGRLALTGEGGSGRVGPAELTWQRHAVPPPGEAAGAKGAGSPRVGLRLTVRSPAPCLVSWLAVDKAGTGWLAGVIGSLAPSGSHLPLLDGMAALEIKVLTIQQASLPFTLSDIPTKERPPAQLLPVTFPGQDAPLSFDPPAVEGGKVSLRVRNHTSKAVEEVRLTLVCRDGRGARLGTVSVVHPPLVRQAELPPPVVGASATAAFQPAAVLPGTTARCEVGLVRVLFLDGTTWAPPAR
jgi:hypothetical protein